MALLTAAEVAQLLRCRPGKIVKLVESGRLAYLELAGGSGREPLDLDSWRFRPSAVRALLDGLETLRVRVDRGPAARSEVASAAPRAGDAA